MQTTQRYLSNVSWKISNFKDLLSKSNIKVTLRRLAAKQEPNTATIWGKMTYGVSKIAVSALTRVYQRMLDNEIPFRNISVNCVHPGYVITDMTSRTGFLTTEEGAIAPLYLALEPHGLKGQYVWSDCSVVDWLAPKTPALY